MATTRQGGPGIKLPPNFPVYNLTASTSWSTQPAGAVALAGGGVYIIPAGQYFIETGVLTSLQVKDQLNNTWRPIAANAAGGNYVSSDGANFRLINIAQVVVSATITNAGTGYTSAPTITASAGGAVLQAVIGGAVNSTITITTAGLGYTHVPTLIISAPPPGGIQATATAALTGTAISAVTVAQAGAGYTAAPTVTVLPDARDSITTPAVLTATITGAGTITGINVLDEGTPQGSAPTLAFAGGGGASGAATAVRATGTSAVDTSYIYPI